MKSLVDQYSDCIKILRSRFDDMHSTLGLTSTADPIVIRRSKILLDILAVRVSSLSSDGALFQTQFDLPEGSRWYVYMESQTDLQFPWRIGAAIERLGTSLLAPIKVLHGPDTSPPLDRFEKLRERVLTDIVSGLTPKLVALQSWHGASIVDIAIGDELLVRTIKLSQALSPVGIMGEGRLSWDLMGVNRYEDICCFETLQEECAKWMDDIPKFIT